MNSSLTILYAEDDPDIQMIAGMALEDIGGFKLHFCNNGKEAVSGTKEISPDIILLDVMMPEMDGPTAFLQLQERFGDALAPVIFITAKASSQETSRLMNLGATAVITKPFDPMTLADEIQSIWRESQHG